MTDSDRQLLRWLIMRSAVVGLALLAMLVLPLVVLWFIPRGVFAGHAAAHAMWQAVAMLVWIWAVGRSIVRRSRLPGEAIGLIAFAIAFLIAGFGIAVVTDVTTRFQNAALAAFFVGCVIWNASRLVRAWRGGWRPAVSGNAAGQHVQEKGAA